MRGIAVTETATGEQCAKPKPTWHHGRWLAFDVESTSADPEDARIVSAALVLCGGGEPTYSRTVLVDPGVEVPAEATAVHGITTAQAHAHGKLAPVGVAEIIDFLAGHDLPLAAFCGRYDFTVLDREARRYGLVSLMDRREFQLIDPFVIDKALDRYRRGSRKLDAVCAHYGVRLDDAHRAESDAISAARLAWVMVERGRVVRSERDAGERAEAADLRAVWETGRQSPVTLHLLQRAWAADQARGLEEYFVRSGDPQRVARAWPVIPFGVEGS
jgi:DNA polymerase III subunit epsilon